MALKVVPDSDWRIQWADLWFDHIKTVPQMFYSTVKHHGTRPANTYWTDNNWKTINYQEWASISEEIGNGLLSLGVNRGDNIVIMSPTCVEWGWVDIGIEMAGGCTTTIFPSLSSDDVEFIVNHSQVTYFFVGSPELLQKIEILQPKLPSIKGFICMSGNFRGDESKTWNLEQLRQLGRDYMSKKPRELGERVQSLTENDAATTVYTSGTTGKLKAARLTHGEVIGGLWRSIRNCAMGNIEYNSDDVYLSVMPLAHIMERTYAFFCTISVGGCIAYGRGPAFVIQDMQAIRPTWMVMVPRMMDRILKGIKQFFAATPEGEKLWNWAMDVGSQMIDARLSPENTIDSSIDPLDELTGQLREEYIRAKELVFDKVKAALGGRLRCFASGGAALLPELHRPFLGMGMYVPNGYGLTETLCGVGVSRANTVKVSWNAPIAPGLEWKQDEDGELLLKGVGVIKEYYNDPESNEACFTEDGFFRTGDIVEFDENGIFRVVDRKKAIIVMDTGKNVAPAKPEALVLRETLIDQVLVIGDGRKYITALIGPNWDEMMRILDSRGVEYDKSSLRYELVNGMKTCVEVGPDLVENPIVRDIVEKAVGNANAELADFEAIKKYVITPRKFLQSRDELTPTSKTKSRVIIKNFAAEIESMY